jgi:alpha-glucosidase
MVVSLWLAPFRLDVHRADGTPVVETAQDEQGRYWAYATLNDAFTVRRRCRQEDGIFGLGEKTGHQNRKGRDFTLWNTDVLNPDATGEFRAGLDPADPRADRTSTEFDPYYISIPFFYHQSYPSGGMSGSFVDNAYRAAYEFSPREEYRFHFSGGQYTEYIFAGPRMPEILEAYTWLTGRTEPPPLWALGYHQCRWFNYTQEAIEAHPVRCALARHRVHGRLPRLHLERTVLPRRARDAATPARHGFPRHHHHRPRREAGPGLLGLRPGGGARRAVPHRGW